MSALRLSLDASSPLITYSPQSQWRALSPSDDGDSGRYANSSSAMVTGGFQAPFTGGKMQFSFNGTGVYIYGAKRGNHGFYTVAVDNGQAQQFDGNPNGPDQFGAQLFSVSNLSNGQHTVTVVNTGGAPNPNDTGRVWWDCDWIDYDTQIAVANASSAASSVQQVSYEVHQDGAFTLGPSSDTWSLSTYTGDPSGQTLRTTTDGATLSFNFTTPPSGVSGGAMMALYGAVSNTSGNLVASLSAANQPTRSSVLSAYYGFGTLHQVLLFEADNLAPATTYVLDVRNSAVTGSDGTRRTALFIDQVRTWSTGAGTTGGGASGSNGGSGGGGSNAGAIAGGVVGGILGLAIIAALIFFMMRKKRRAKQTAFGGEGRPKHSIDAVRQPEVQQVSANGYTSVAPFPASQTELGLAQQQFPNTYNPSLTSSTPYGVSPYAPVVAGTVANNIQYTRPTMPTTASTDREAFFGANGGAATTTGSSSAYGGFASESGRSDSIGTGAHQTTSSFARDEALKRSQLHVVSNSSPTPSSGHQRNLSGSDATSMDAATTTTAGNRRRERDGGLIMRARDLEEEDEREEGESTILPPQYEDARQEGERRRA